MENIVKLLDQSYELLVWINQVPVESFIDQLEEIRAKHSEASELYEKAHTMATELKDTLENEQITALHELVQKIQKIMDEISSKTDQLIKQTRIEQIQKEIKQASK